MKDVMPLEAANDDALYNRALDCLSNLAARVANRSQLLEDFKQAERVIETLPLGSDEYRTVKEGLRNARRYQRSAEFGASRFELNLLVRSLKASKNQATSLADSCLDTSMGEVSLHIDRQLQL